MKKIFSFTMIAIAAITVTMSSCKKYEDGPGMTVRTAKARVTGEWTMSKYLYNGTDMTTTVMPSGTTMKTSIVKDGTWTSTWSDGTTSISSNGTWEFVDKKTKLKMVTTGSADTDGDTSTISMLKSKEMHLQETDGTDVSEWHMIQE
jgi:hypothetical protein